MLSDCAGRSIRSRPDSSLRSLSRSFSRLLCPLASVVLSFWLFSGKNCTIHSFSLGEIDFLTRPTIVQAPVLNLNRFRRAHQAKNTSNNNHGTNHTDGSAQRLFQSLGSRCLVLISVGCRIVRTSSRPAQVLPKRMAFVANMFLSLAFHFFSYCWVAAAISSQSPSGCSGTYPKRKATERRIKSCENLL